MHLNVARDQIYPCVVDLAGIAGHTNGVIEALRGVRLYADVSSQTLTLTANDLAMALQYSIDAEVEDGGCVVVTAALLKDVLRLAKKDVITINTDLYARQLKLDTGALYHLSFLPGDDFPMPEFSIPDESVTISGVPDLAARLVHMAAAESGESNLHGVKLTFSDQGLKAACSDGGNRVAQVTLPGENRAGLDMLIPAKALGVLASLVGREDVLYVGTTRNSAVFYDGVMTFSVRLLSGNFLDTDKLLDYVKPAYAIVVNKGALCQALSLAAAIPDTQCLKIKIGGDCLEVSGMYAAGGCTSIVPVIQGNGPAPAPFYYGANLLQSVMPLTDPLALLFSEQGHLLACDATTKLFQNPMRPPSQQELEQKAAAAKKTTDKKKTGQKKTEKKTKKSAASTPEKEVA